MVPRSRSMARGCLSSGDVLLSGDLIAVSFIVQGPSKLPNPCKSQVRAYSERRFTQLVSTGIIVARGAVPAPLFVYPDGLPILRFEFDASLNQLLHFCGCDTSAFKGRSFRIGAATAAALKGDYDAQIRTAGRWTSDAFKK